VSNCERYQGGRDLKRGKSFTRKKKLTKRGIIPSWVGAKAQTRSKGGTIYERRKVCHNVFRTGGRLENEKKKRGI